MWELIRSNRRKSLALFLFLGGLFLVMGYLFGTVLYPGGDPALFVGISLLIWLGYCIFAYYSGADLLLRASAARPVDRDSDRRLFNVVEEMKIAGGLKSMPKIYIMPEDAMNAMAVGRGPDDCAIVVTSGLLAKLDRDELQGVVAHEMSHIINRDSLFMTFAGATLGSISLISSLFWRSLRFTRFRSRSSRDAGGLVVFWILAIALAAAGVFLAQLFYLAILRKREYLADASAVRLTRYPDGLASALEKIDNSDVAMIHYNKITAPMFIASPTYGNRFSLFNMSTHPPIQERIMILRKLSGASYKDYQMAYSRVLGKRGGLIPKRSLGAENDIALRAQSPRATPENMIDIKRNLGDTLLTADSYIFLNCVCGLKIKVPPALNGKTIDCPKCGHRFAGSLA